MNFSEFCKITEALKIKHPIWFELSSNVLPTDDDIKAVEKHFGITLNDEYKSFVKRYGGGLFAFTKILTCTDDDSFILKYNSREFVKEYSFIAAADFETGDFAGFKISEGKCSSEVYIFNHEEKKILASDIGNFFDFVNEYCYSV